MRCLYPIEVVDRYGYPKMAPCGQCINCRLNYARQWSIRITHEQLKYGDNSCFLTLTYDEEHLPADRSVHRKVLSSFLKRLRKALGTKKIRFFGCGEYGGLFGRPHYHVIIFGLPVDSNIFKNRHVHYEHGKVCGWHADLPCWKNGKVHIGTVTSDSANYVAGYVVKKVKGKGAKEYYDNLGLEPEFVLMSRRPGIGSDYVDSHGDYYSIHRFVTIKGVKYPMPRYYVDKVGKKYSTAQEVRDFLKSKGVPQEKLDGYVRAVFRGFDPLYKFENAQQEERNVKSKMKLKGSLNV